MNTRRHVIHTLLAVLVTSVQCLSASAEVSALSNQGITGALSCLVGTNTDIRCRASTTNGLRVIEFTFGEESMSAVTVSVSKGGVQLSDAHYAEFCASLRPILAEKDGNGGEVDKIIEDLYSSFMPEVGSRATSGFLPSPGGIVAGVTFTTTDTLYDISVQCIGFHQEGTASIEIGPLEIAEKLSELYDTNIKANQ